MSESVRSGMKATLSQLLMWPPAPEMLRGVAVDVNDCAYEDMSKPLPEIAQLFFNDEQRRLQGNHLSELKRRVVTASFILDFAVSTGMELSALPETQEIMLEEFTRRVDEWTRGQEAATSGARAAFLNGLGFNPAADVARKQVTQWWEDNWQI